MKKETDVIFSEGEDELKKEEIKIKTKIRYLLIKSAIVVLNSLKFKTKTKKTLPPKK